MSNQPIPVSGVGAPVPLSGGPGPIPVTDSPMYAHLKARDYSSRVPRPSATAPLSPSEVYESIHEGARPKGSVDRPQRRVRDLPPPAAQPAVDLAERVAALERQVQALLAANGALRDELAEAQNIAAGAA